MTTKRFFTAWIALMASNWTWACRVVPIVFGSLWKTDTRQSTACSIPPSRPVGDISIHVQLINVDKRQGSFYDKKIGFNTYLKPHLAWGLGTLRNKCTSSYIQKPASSLLYLREKEKKYVNVCLFLYTELYTAPELHSCGPASTYILV